VLATFFLPSQPSTFRILFSTALSPARLDPAPSTYLPLVYLDVPATPAAVASLQVAQKVHIWGQFFFKMLLALAFNAVLLALAAVAATVLVIKYMFLLPLDETLNDTQQLCFESPNSTQPIVAPSLLRRDKADANGGTTALKSLTVVIPAYNEELRLPGTLDETMRYVP
jgi:hypothetical protein